MASLVQLVQQLAGSVPNATSAGKFVVYYDQTAGALRLKDNLGNTYPVATTNGLKDPVRAVSTAGLPGYLRIGNTITATANGALPTQDGVTLTTNDSFLYIDGIGGTGPDNGIWVVTQVGSGGSPFILNRRGDFAVSGQVTTSALIPVGPEGTLFKNTVFTLATVQPITLNTTSLDFESISGEGGSGGVGGFTRIPPGLTRTVPADEQVIVYGALKIEGTLKLDGSIVGLKMPEPTVEVPLVSTDFDVPNAMSVRVPVDPSSGPLTVRLPSSGTVGQEVVIKNVTSSVNVITVDGVGRRLDGALSRVLNSGFEVLRLSRKFNQQWSVES